jgi:O-antigen ligase
LINEAGIVQGAGMERTQYARARLLANIITVAGWLYLFMGVAGFIFSYFNEMLDFNFLPTLSAIIVGVLALAIAQLINATVDTADNSLEILAELRKLNDSLRSTSSSDP